MPTRVTYNGVPLGLVRTVKVEQKSKLDPTNTDMLYIANRLSYRTILTVTPDGFLGNINLALAPGVAGQFSPAVIMRAIRMRLLQPRKAFAHVHDDDGGISTLVESDADSDAANGPFPIDCDITQVTDRTFLVDYVIEVNIPGCDTNQQFASNRFETTHDINERGYSTITTLGRVIVRSDMKRSPDSLRPIITPPMPMGFRRKSMYQVTEDGLAMNYRIVDTEVFLAPPTIPGVGQAVEARGRLSVTSTPPGAILYAQVDIHLEGRKDMPKRQLVELAILLALRRLEQTGVMRNPKNSKPMVLGGAVSEELFDNAVDVSLRGMLGVGQGILVPNESGQQAAGWFAQFMADAMVGQPFNNGANPIGAQVIEEGWKGLRDKLTPGSGGAQTPGTAGAAGAVAGAIAGQQAKKAKTEPGDAANKPPQTRGATLDSGLLDKFGGGMVGTDQQGSIDPGLRGNLNFLALVAAAFRDPCVVDAASILNRAPNSAAGPSPVLQTPRSQQTGEWGGREVEFENHTVEFLSWQRTAVDYLYREGQAWLAKYGDPSPALDWRRGRLRALYPPNGGNVIIGVVESLPEIDKPIVADDFPGWYETWFAEVIHDVTASQDVLPATVVGRVAKRVGWANPQRTIRVRWAATKSGFPPQVPIISGDANIVIIRHVMELPTMEINADGQTPKFTVSGETWYKPLDETYLAVRWPTPPWLRVPMTLTPSPVPDPSVIVSQNNPPAIAVAARSAVFGGAGGGA